MFRLFKLIILLSAGFGCKEAIQFRTKTHSDSLRYSESCWRKTEFPEIISSQIPPIVLERINSRLKHIPNEIEHSLDQKFHFLAILQNCGKTQKKANFNLTYDITYQSDKLLSILFQAQIETANMAHGLNFGRGMIFNLVNGEILEPPKLFTGQSDRKIFNITYYTALQAYDKANPNCLFDRENFPGPEALKNAYLDSNDYVVFFNPYEIAPYSCSTIKLRFPLEIFLSRMSINN